MGSFIRHIHYKGYETTIYYEEETDNFYGYIEYSTEIQFTFGGKTIDETLNAFKQYVDKQHDE